MDIKFSVVIPVFNRGDLLIRALESVVNQTFNSYEIVIINDASTEDISKILEPYLSNKKINYINLKNNVGGAEARNIGLENSKGEFIAFLDSDDFWELTKLELCNKKLIENTNCKILFHETFIKKEKKTIHTTINKDFKKYNHIFNFIVLTRTLLQTSSFVIESKLINRIRFNPKLKKHQDLDVYIKLSDLYLEVDFIYIPLSTWDISHENVSISRKSNLKYSLEWIENNKNLIKSSTYYMFILESLYSRNVTSLFNDDFKKVLEGIKKRDINILDFIKYTTIKVIRIIKGLI